MVFHDTFDAMRLVIRPVVDAPNRSPRWLHINDYWPKTDISAHRMRTILTGLIRSFRDIQLIQAQKLRLEGMQAALFESERYGTDALASGVTHDVNMRLHPLPVCLDAGRH